jgi:hypothetical protein
LAQKATTLVNKVVLGVILKCSKAKFEENFIVYAWDDIDAFLRNTYLDTYHVDVLKGGSKLIIIPRLVDRSISLNVKYQASLIKVGIHLVSLQQLQEKSFLILMRVDESTTKSKTKGAKSLAYLYFQYN